MTEYQIETNEEEEERFTLPWGFQPGRSGNFIAGPPRRIDYCFPSDYETEYLKWLLNPGETVFGGKSNHRNPILKNNKEVPIWDYKCNNSKLRNGQLYPLTGEFGIYELMTGETDHAVFSGNEPLMFEMPTSWWHSKKPPLKIQVWNSLNEKHLSFNLMQTQTARQFREASIPEIVHLYSEEPGFPKESLP